MRRSLVPIALTVLLLVSWLVLPGALFWTIEEWKSFKVHYRYKNTIYHIEVMQILADEKMMVTVDGVEKDENMITLIDEGAEHNVVVAPNKKLKMPLKIKTLKLIDYKAVP